jgi:predicted HicB family RNase H-like nuclease
MESIWNCALNFPRSPGWRQSPKGALLGIRKVAAEAVADMQANSEPAPEPLAERRYSGEFRVRIPPQMHRSLVMEAAEQGVSLNRLASAKLAS